MVNGNTSNQMATLRPANCRLATSQALLSPRITQLSATRKDKDKVFKKSSGNRWVQSVSHRAESSCQLEYTTKANGMAAINATNRASPANGLPIGKPYRLSVVSVMIHGHRQQRIHL